jgi:hypothetical protein
MRYARHAPGTSSSEATAVTWRSGGLVAARLRQSPGTSIYLLILGLTTVVLALDGSRDSHALLLATSTNLDRLSTHPLVVLIVSALWTPGLGYLFWLLVFLAVSVPLERRVGTRRWVGVFVAGHVGATLLTAGSIWLGIAIGSVKPSVSGSMDVGVSYGIAAVAAFLLLELRRPHGRVLLAALLAVLVARLVVDRTFTDVGHVYALGIGLALWQLQAGSARRRVNRRALTRNRMAMAAVFAVSVVGAALLQRSVVPVATLVVATSNRSPVPAIAKATLAAGSSERARSHVLRNS